MADHVIIVEPYSGAVKLLCSCVGNLPVATLDGETDDLTLDVLNRLAHEHIEAAERTEGQQALARMMDSAPLYGINDSLTGAKITEEYRSSSAVTDPKELVSLLGPEEETPPGLPFDVIEHNMDRDEITGT